MQNLLKKLTIYKLIIIGIMTAICITMCGRKPTIEVDEIVDLSYSELKQKFTTCKGSGKLSMPNVMPLKLGYTFTTQNDSSYIQFKDIFGRKILFVQSLPQEVMLWDMRKNVKYNPSNHSPVPIFEMVEPNEIAEILWGEIPIKYEKGINESNIKTDSTEMNFELAETHLGGVVKKVIFNVESNNSTVELSITDRFYGEADKELLKGIPNNIPFK